MWIFLVFLSHIFTVVSLNALTAPVGGRITFHCSHILADGNIKYFCKGSCSEENILIRSETGVNPSHTGRYTLYDEGSDFTVTIADLRLSDSGTYICAVDRLLVDTYNYVTLRVIEVFTLTPVPRSASRPPARRTTTDITDNKRTSVTRQLTADTSPKTIRRSALSDPLVYVGAGLGALVLIFTVVLFIFIKLKYKLKRCSSSLTSSVQPDSLIYTTPNVTSQSDSLDYSSVKFIKKPNCSVKTSEMFEMNPNERVETLYSSVQNQHQSDITDPNSIIYSSVRKGL
ncbi:CMRF35-like molecule 8 [Labeo rohita]|uniref:CMRF35-like molecule 8 n=1 Tax=Labeo rohita TaxID=84645 RepID=UPI0021E27E31|nr:CMRF35-like molecule 8 [Labeo rohita]